MPAIPAKAFLAARAFPSACTPSQAIGTISAQGVDEGSDDEGEEGGGGGSSSDNGSVEIEFSDEEEQEVDVVTSGGAREASQGRQATLVGARTPPPPPPPPQQQFQAMDGMVLEQQLGARGERSDLELDDGSDSSDGGF